MLNEYASFFVYLLMFAIVTFLFYLGGKRGRKTYIILGVLLLTIFAGIRYTTGTDTATYNKFYDEVSNEPISHSIDRFMSGEMEPFIIIVVRLGSSLGFGSWFMFGIFAFITAYFLYRTAWILDKKHFWVLYGVFLLMVFPNSFNTMRQMAAMSVLSFALVGIIKRHIKDRRVRYTKLILSIIFAITLHYASIALLPVFLIPYITNKIGYRRAFLVFGILAVIIAFLYGPALNFLVESSLLPVKHYETFMDTEGSLLNFNFIICAIIAIIAAFHYRSRKNNNPVNENYLPIITAGAAYAAIGFYSGYLGRLADFFWPFAVMMIWNILNETKEKPLKKIAIMYIIALAYFILAFVIMGTNELFPYNTIIGGVK